MSLLAKYLFSHWIYCNKTLRHWLPFKVQLPQLIKLSHRKNDYHSNSCADIKVEFGVVADTDSQYISRHKTIFMWIFPQPVFYLLPPLSGWHSHGHPASVAEDVSQRAGRGNQTGVCPHRETAEEGFNRRRWGFLVIMSRSPCFWLCLFVFVVLLETLFFFSLACGSSCCSGCSQAFRWPAGQRAVWRWELWDVVAHWRGLFLQSSEAQTLWGLTGETHQPSGEKRLLAEAQSQRIRSCRSVRGNVSKCFLCEIHPSKWAVRIITADYYMCASD